MLNPIVPQTKEELALTLCLIVGVFFTPLYMFSFTIFGVFLTPIDIVFLAIFTYVSFNSIAVRKSIYIKYSIVPAVIVPLIIVATFVGLFLGNETQTVLRETKLVIFFICVAVFAHYVSRERIDLIRLFRILVILTTLGSFYDLYARINNIYPVSAFSGNIAGAVSYAFTPFGLLIRDYGWVSTFHYQVFASIIAFSFVIYTKNFRERIFFSTVLLINFATNLLTVTRGFLVGLLVGFTITTILWMVSASKGGQLHLSQKAYSLLKIFFVIVPCYLIIGYIYPPITASFSRLQSIFKPESAVSGDINNMEYRIESIELGWNTALDYPLGHGFGISSAAYKASPEEKRHISLLYHNSLGYIFYSFGLIGGFALILLFIYLGVRATLNTLISTGKSKTVLVISTSTFFSLLAMTFTSGNYLFSVDSVLPFVILQFAILSSKNLAVNIGV